MLPEPAFPPAPFGVRLERCWGLPAWEELFAGPQRSMRYASPAFAARECGPWARELVDAMCAGLRTPVVDVRFWEHLDTGQRPGPDHWHVDDLYVGGGRHRLYFAGAGSWTEFEAERPGLPDFTPPEGWIVGYDQSHRHRVRAAKVPGPRVFLRVSESSNPPLNRIVPPPVVR